MSVFIQRFTASLVLASISLLLAPAQVFADPRGYRAGNFEIVMEPRSLVLHEAGVPVFTTAWTRDEIGTTLTYSVGPDTMIVEVRCGEVLVSVNGTSARVLRTELEDDAITEETKRALDVVAASFVDGEAFDAALADFGLTMSRFPADAYPDGWLDCAACAAALIGYGIAIGALISACGGPAAGWACVAAFLRLTVGKVSVLASCTRCVTG